MSRKSLILVLVLGALVLTAVLTNRTRVVFQEDSPSGLIRVVERSDGLRELYIGGSRARQTALYPGRPGHLELPYTRVAMTGLALVPEDARILFVGLGGGAMPTYTRHLRPRARIQTVELEPLVVEAARDWFGFRTDSLMSVHAADGRVFIEEAPPGTWDLIFLDAFSDGDVPRALSTVEFLQAVARALTPAGVVVSNLHTASPRYEAMVATYQAVFQEVALVQVPGRRQRILLARTTADPGAVVEDRIGSPGDTVMAPGAGIDLRRESVVEAVRSLARDRELGFDLVTIVEGGFDVPNPPDVQVLHDGG
ncbi:MAG: fused MFS/spermidine synthase [Gemmatimonadota bacterium]|jgi:spermidine synthase